MYGYEEWRGAAEGKLLHLVVPERREYREAGCRVEDKPDVRHDSSNRAPILP